MNQFSFPCHAAALLSTILRDPNWDTLNFESNFALWLVITYAEVWSNLSLDITREVYADFPKWSEFNGKQTIENLVKLRISDQMTVNSLIFFCGKQMITVNRMKLMKYSE